MKRMHKLIIAGLLVLALVPGLASAAYPITISGYVGMNNSASGNLAYPTMLQGWTVDLRYNVDSYGSILQTTTTDVNGYYTFTVNGPTAMYRTILTVQPTYKAANPASALLGQSVDGSKNYVNQNFSVYKLPQVTIIGHKYLDPDGKHTDKSTPLAGWTINLYSSSGKVFVTSAVTDATGAYSFQIPDFGIFFVNESPQTGYVKSYPTSNPQFSHNIAKGQVGTFTDDMWNAQALDIKISGHKYNDPDGKHTDTTTPLAGWTMKLLNQSGATYVERASTTTDATGYFEFRIKAPGHYLVQEVPVTGYKASSPVSGQTAFMIDFSSTDQVADFWNYVLPSVTISGHKYSDPDGKHTDTSTPLAGVTMELYLGLVKQTETTTAADGSYSFTVNDLGSWRVSEVVPSGYTQTWPYGDYGYMILPGDTDPLTDQDFWNKPDQGPVPVPEFPTIAVSILTISGMFIAVQFLKKRN